MSKYVVVSGWVLCCWCVRVKRDRPPLPRTVGWLVNAQLSTPRCNNGAFFVWDRKRAGNKNPMRCAPFAGVSTRRCEEGTGWGSQDDDGLRYRLGCIHVGSECRPQIVYTAFG